MKKKYKLILVNNEYWGYVVHTHVVHIYSPTKKVTSAAHTNFDYSINEETAGMSMNCIRPAMVKDYIKKNYITQ